MFDWAELKQQTIIAVENPEEKVIAFLNIIPDYAPGEGTYDLIRKTNDAPNGILDFILIELFRYLKSQNFSTVNDMPGIGRKNENYSKVKRGL